MSALLQDLRYARRSLARSPGLTAAAVLTLAFGVGANTTAFAWVRAVLLDAVPGSFDQARLRVIFSRAPSGEAARFSLPDYRDLARRSDVLSGLLAQRWIDVALGTISSEAPPRLSGALVSGNYFDVLGVRPLLGRGFSPGEDAGRGSPPVAVLGHSAWQRFFRADPAVVGRAIRLNGRPFTVVGVAPPGFFGSFLGIGADIWIPISQAGTFEPACDRLEDRGQRSVLCLGRLKKGVTTARARETLEAEAARLNRDYPGLHDGYGIGVVALRESPWGGPAEFGPIVQSLLALTALVLLIACANVANLLVNRALGRRREIAIRLALGASRGQIARQVLLEGLLLAGLSGAVAALATFWTSGLLLLFVPPTGLPVRMNLGVDWRIVAFALGVSFAGSLAFALLPALQLSRMGVTGHLAAESAAIAGGRGRSRLRRALAAGQMALSLALLSVAALFLRSFVESRRLDPGFQTRGILLVELRLFSAGYTPVRSAAFLDALQGRTRDLPGVRGATLARRVPLGFGGFPSAPATVEGYAPRAGEETRVRYNAVSKDYFRTLGTRLIAGREFSPSDRMDSEPVAIINEAFARRSFEGREALGGRVRFEGIARRVVGVAADARYEKLGQAPLPFLFLPLSQTSPDQAVLHLRTSGDPSEVLPAVRAAIRTLDPGLPLFEIQTMQQHLGEELFGQRVGSSLLGAVGGLALLLSGIGLYALCAKAVMERRREIGLRIALGASPGRLLRGFLADGLRLAGLGAAAGLAGGFAMARAIASELPGIEPSDPIAFASVTLAVALIAIAASYVPARRAMRVDPASALRGE